MDIEIPIDTPLETILTEKLSGRYIDKRGDTGWYRNGRLHRDGAPALIQADGTKTWYQNGEVHRDGAPALEDANGNSGWWCRGMRHREDGAAIEYFNGTKRWFINGDQLTEAEFLDFVQVKQAKEEFIRAEECKRAAAAAEKAHHENRRILNTHVPHVKFRLRKNP